jgi:hypothetical protein
MMVKVELFTLPKHLSSPLFFSSIRVFRSLVFYVMFSRSLFVLLSFFIWPLPALVSRRINYACSSCLGGFSVRYCNAVHQGMCDVDILFTCEASLHCSIISLIWEVKAHTIRITLPLFIEVSVSRHGIGWSCLCVLVVSSMILLPRFFDWMLELFWQWYIRQRKK